MTSGPLLAIVLAATSLPGRSVHAVAPTMAEAETLARARVLLASTVAGRAVAEFLDKEAVPVSYGDLPAHLHGGYGKDPSGRPVILLARGRSALNLALTLAHEGTHARQDLEWHLADCVEKETEAFLKELQVHKELDARGEKGADFEAELRLRVLQHAGGVDTVVQQVRDGYASEEFQMTRDASPAQRKEWEAAHALDEYRPVRDLLKAERSPERRLALKRAQSHWAEVLQSFKLN